MKYEIIGKNIRKQRELLGLTQKQLAEQLGISSARLSNWESGINRPDVDMLAKLCGILNISANKLLALDSSSDNLSEEAIAVAHAFDNASPEIRAAIRALVSVSSAS
ncbi:MAG: helix-turn-helix transcriptional regulator [Christensenellaceae bacterium]|nr:helix-turn-helix transcriptional regulator [Christensenellaceae bacterium]